jgi:glycerol-3-phosphate dehydrogenase
MVAVEGRLTNMAVSHLQLPGDGDVIVPQRNLSILGTSSWTVEDPDGIIPRGEDAERMIRKTALLAPKVEQSRVVAVWAAARPLIGFEEEGRTLSRTFRCFDHGERDGLEGLVSIAGGKATVLRAMAETTVDLICRKLGVQVPCSTREARLLPFRSYYRNAGS